MKAHEVELSKKNLPTIWGPGESMSKAEVREKTRKLHEDLVKAHKAAEEIERNIPTLERKGWSEIL